MCAYHVSNFKLTTCLSVSISLMPPSIPCSFCCNHVSNTSRVFQSVHTQCVRGYAYQPRLFVAMVLVLIFAEVLGLYGLIVGLILNTKTGDSRCAWDPNLEAIGSTKSTLLEARLPTKRYQRLCTVENVMMGNAKTAPVVFFLFLRNGGRESKMGVSRPLYVFSMWWCEWVVIGVHVSHVSCVSKIG